eukprot:m.31718 g.31718  ORF g.31718 m.31718 type:complete len:248 (-) comp9820_c0_seq1:109-852(-)
MSRALRVLCYGDSLTAGHTMRAHLPWADNLQTQLGGPEVVECVDAVGLCGLTAKELAEQLDKPRGTLARGVCGQKHVSLAELLEHSVAAPSSKGKRRNKKTAGSSTPFYDVVLIMLGTNDMGYGYAVEDIAANVTKLHACCHDRNVRTVALAMPSSAACASREELGSKRDTLNRLFHQMTVEQNTGGAAGGAVSTGGSTQRCLFVDLDDAVPYSSESGQWSWDGLHMSQDGYEAFGRALAPRIAPWL